MDEEGEKPTECYACCFEKPIGGVNKYENRKQERDMWLCNICASTKIGTAYEYPSQYPDKNSLITIGWIANHFLKIIKKTT